MLDSDVATLYNYNTKRINETVRRNKERFPNDFCFKLTDYETKSLKSQIATLNKKGRGKHRKYLPYAFTEQGIAMLSGLLKNEIAIQVSINIMNAFVEMRRLILKSGQTFQEINTIKGKLLEYDKKFDKVFDELQKQEVEEFNQKIFFGGQIYDAYSLVVDIIKTAQNKILIIDNYINDNVLKMLSKKNKDVEVMILTTSKSNIRKLDIKKFNEQYPKLKMLYTNKFHDRFIVIDDKDLYHIGASLKDLGKKCFAISKIEDREYMEKMKVVI